MSLTGLSVEEAVNTAKSAWINNLVACGLSILLNSISTAVLIWSKNIPRLLKYVCGILKLCEILFSAFFIIACPIFAAVDSTNFDALMIVNVGIDTSPGLSMFFLMNSLILLTQQIFHSPITCFIRYLQVCRKGVHVPHVLLLLSSNIVFLAFSAGLLCYASVPTAEDQIILSGYSTAYNGHPTAFLVLSYDKDVHMSSVLLSGITYCVILVFSVLIMLFCYFRINARINSNPNQSFNLMKMQKRANLILVTNFILTIIFIQLPFVYSVIGPVLGLSQGLATYLLSILFVWGPVANAAVLFVFKTEVRRVVFQCAKDSDLNVVNVGERSAIKSDGK